MGFFTSASAWGVGIVSGYNQDQGQRQSTISPIVPVGSVVLNAMLISVENVAHVPHIRLLPLLAVASIGISATTYLSGHFLGRVLTTIDKPLTFNLQAVL